MIQSINTVGKESGFRFIQEESMLFIKLTQIGKSDGNAFFFFLSESMLNLRYWSNAQLEQSNKSFEKRRTQLQVDLGGQKQPPDFLSFLLLFFNPFLILLPIKMLIPLEFFPSSLITLKKKLGRVGVEIKNRLEATSTYVRSYCLSPW